LSGRGGGDGWLCDDEKQKHNSLLCCMSSYWQLDGVTLTWGRSTMPITRPLHWEVSCPESVFPVIWIPRLTPHTQ
jgi:hypothetical protein